MSEFSVTPAEIKKLKSRWSLDQLAEVSTALLGCTGVVSVECCGTHHLDGQDYSDLRGVTIQNFIANVAISNVDLSFSSLNGVGGRIHTVLRHCRFAKVDFSESVLAVKAYFCDFNSVKIKEVFGHFEDCSFVNANLNRVLSVDLHFYRCDFSKANMLNTHLFSTIFDNCKWDGCKLGQGSFAESTFIGTMPSNEQLGDTIMDDVVFQMQSGSPS